MSGIESTILNAPAPILLPSHPLAEVAEEEGGDGRGVSRKLADRSEIGQHPQLHPRQRQPHRAGSCRLTQGHPRQLPGLGLAVAVADLQARGLPPGVQHLGVERLARGHHPAQALQRSQGRALGDHAVLGRRHAQQVHALFREQLQALGRVEARVVQQCARTREPGRDEHVARALAPARGGRAPHQLAGLCAQPMVGLQALPVEVALRVNHGLRLACGAARERDQTGFLRRQLERGEGLGREQGIVGHEQHRDRIRVDARVRRVGTRVWRARTRVRRVGTRVWRVGTRVWRVGTRVWRVRTRVRRVGTRVRRVGTRVWRVGTRERRLQLGPVALVGDDQRRVGRLDPQAQVFRPQLLGAWQHDGADPEAGDHREHPLGPIADQRHHHIAPSDAAPRERSRQARAALAHLAEAPLAPRARARQLDQRQALRGHSIEHVAGEVHGRSTLGRVSAR